VNCSQKLISLIFGTTFCWLLLWKPSCELLSKVDIFDIRNNHFFYSSLSCFVVNCSQKLISLIFGTTNRKKERPWTTLWIALKSWYLWYSEQRTRKRCIRIYVVNCSQKLISLIFGTTHRSQAPSSLLLWIALKSWYLWYSEQPWEKRIKSETCCELLSKVDIFDIRNNNIVLV